MAHMPEQMHDDAYQVAILVTDGFEEAELTEPVLALGKAGAKVTVISTHEGRIQAFNHMDKSKSFPVDMTLEQADPSRFQALLLPGGALNADALRVEPKAMAFIQAIAAANKPMAVICHAPWELISADLVRGRTLTGYHTIQDDVRNAGGTFVDQEVVVDGNLVTSRQPSDLPAFNREMLKAFSLTADAALKH